MILRCGPEGFRSWLSLELVDPMGRPETASPDESLACVAIIAARAHDVLVIAEPKVSLRSPTPTERALAPDQPHRPKALPLTTHAGPLPFGEDVKHHRNVSSDSPFIG